MKCKEDASAALSAAADWRTGDWLTGLKIALWPVGRLAS
jgi:hypothetical protein